MWWIILIISVVIIVGTFNVYKYIDKVQKRSKVLHQKLKNIDNFSITKKIIGLKCIYILAIDQTNLKVVYVDELHKNIINYSDIIGVEIIEDNEKQNNLVSRVEVKILLRNMESPSFVITCFDSLTMTEGKKKSIDINKDPESFKYDIGKENATDIKDSLNAIIDMVDNA